MLFLDANNNEIQSFQYDAHSLAQMLNLFYWQTLFRSATRKFDFNKFIFLTLDLRNGSHQPVEEEKLYSQLTNSGCRASSSLSYAFNEPLLKILLSWTI